MRGLESGRLSCPQTLNPAYANVKALVKGLVKADGRT